jgi:hypothetical protein
MTLAVETWLPGVLAALAVAALLWQAAGPGAAGEEQAASSRPVEQQWPADKPLPALTITDRTPEPLLKAEKPWEDFTVNFARVLRRGGTWHMWYNSYDHTYRHDQDAYLCYARSDEGVRWTRPSLRLFQQ